eukprot:scaffold209614_cov15-Prasinocladus_malaysianus.AAC.1
MSERFCSISIFTSLMPSTPIEIMFKPRFLRRCLFLQHNDNRVGGAGRRPAVSATMSSAV